MLDAQTLLRGAELDRHSLLTEGGVSGVDDVYVSVALFFAMRCVALLRSRW